MKILIFEIIGLLLVVPSFKILWQFTKKKPIADFEFENGSKEFELEIPGNYSISIIGAGFVRQIQKADVRLIINKSQPLKIAVNKIRPRFKQDGRTGIEYWSFSTSNYGHCILTLTNLEGIEAKSSLLGSKRIFEHPIDHNKLRLLVHQSVKPWVKLISIISIVLGAILIFFGFTFLFVK
jgi:hypothetical protein